MAYESTASDLLAMGPSIVRCLAELSHFIPNRAGGVPHFRGLDRASIEMRDSVSTLGEGINDRSGRRANRYCFLRITRLCHTLGGAAAAN